MWCFVGDGCGVNDYFSHYFSAAVVGGVGLMKSDSNSMKRVATHRVAVGAYIFNEDRLLLLKRAHQPFTFAPPGGKLEINEDPVLGLHREILEETGLLVTVLGVAETWFGSIAVNSHPLLCINYVAVSETDHVVLSDEHTEFVWVTSEELAAERVHTNDENGHGYRPRELLNAFHLYRQFSA